MAACISASDHESPLGSATLVSLRRTSTCQPSSSVTLCQVWPALSAVGCSEPFTVSISMEHRR
jgi:hypothetical protein